ncbi:MAG TPA: DUF302 domain-containing protein [Candidatus Binatia bacterium]|jgi:uncharacterized protein (DUF302 family)|nr:DUF302 domain-containing protein [Candidatus Binatia bacterium]
MKKVFPVQHYEHVARRPFDEVVQAFERAVGSAEGDFTDIVAASHDTAEFERLVRAREGSSGFMRFLTADHGMWARLEGMEFRAKMYTIGNPLIAMTMLRHDVGAGLNVPVRVLISEDPTNGTTRVAYDLPSSLMAVLGNDALMEPARALDAKLIKLAVDVTGSEA